MTTNDKPQYPAWYHPIWCMRFWGQHFRCSCGRDRVAFVQHQDNVHKLGKRLLAASMTASQAQDWQDAYEEMIRAELKPLVDAAQAVYDSRFEPADVEIRAMELLAVELKRW